jgi:hypothetical protein
MIEDIHSQDDRFTIKGHWWLPGSTHKVAGDLIYKIEEMTLTLYGGLNDALVDSPFSATPQSTEFPIIYGESLDKVPITILRSFYTNWTPDIRTLAVRPGTPAAILSSQLSCHEMIKGIHLSSPDDVFIKCCIEIPYFENWLGDSPFRFNMAGSGESVSIEYTRPNNEEFTIAACKCLVRFVRSVKPPGFPSSEPSIEHRAYVEVESSEPKPVSWFQTHASEIVDLFSFLYGGNILSRQLTLFKNNTDGNGATLYYRRHKIKPIEYRTMDIVIRYENVKELFLHILENWLAASEIAKRARRIVLSSERRPSAFIEFRFLPLLHAVEILTKEIEHSTIVDHETFKNARKQMLASLPKDIPKELIDSIKSSLGHANGRNLKGKLKKMLNELQDVTCYLFCSSKEMFINGIVNTRNYYTHYSPPKMLLQSVELHWAIQKTSLMLRILLLLKAGVPENDLQQLVHSHYRLSQERAVWGNITEEGSPFHVAYSIEE